MSSLRLLTKTICLALLATCMSARAANEDGAQLYGLVHWDGMQTTNKGVAILPTKAADWTGRLDYQWKITTPPLYPYNYGGCHFEDKYFCTFLRIVDDMILEQKAYIYDDKTGELLNSLQIPTAFNLFDGAYYEPEEIVYAFIQDLSTGKRGWARLNPTTARFELLNLYASIELYGVAVNENGDAYGISGDGGVYSIDRTTGTPTLLFSHPDLETLTVPKAHTGATWDEDNQRIIFAVCNLDKDGGSRLFSVDPQNQIVDLMYKLDGLGTQLAGLYYEQPVDPSAPDRPTSLAVNFAGGSNSGTFTFTLPTQTYSGTTLTGSMSYEVKVDGRRVGTGTGTAGQNITMPVEIAQAGWHTFHVKCSNDHGKGRAAKIDNFVGYETPLAPSEVSARYYAGKMHLSWQPSPPTGDTGGPVNMQTLQYVIASNHGETFITDPDATTFEYTLAEPDTFTPWYYTVAARNADGTSTPVKSNNVPMGVLTDTYTQDFTHAASQFEFTTLDANNDGITWTWFDDGFMAINYNDRLDMDDYLTLPPVRMSHGDFYVLEFDAGVYNFEETFEVKLANDYNQAGMTNATTVYGPVTLEATKLRDQSWHHHNVVVESPDDDKFFLTIHGMSKADMNWLFVDNISLRKLAGGTVPAAVDRLQATADSKGAQRVTLTGSLPTKDVAGNPLSSVDYLKISRDGKHVATVALSPLQATFEWVDENASAGDNSYVVTTGNSTGDGLNARCSVSTGFVEPLAPEDCSLTYVDGDYNTLQFTWTPVTEDLNGKDVGEAVGYNVIRSFDGELAYAAQNLKATTFAEAFDTDTPVYIQYGVYAVVNGLDGDMIVSQQVPVGPPCALPMTEGFYPDIRMPYGIDLNLTSNDSGLYTTHDTDKYQSADNDGGYGVFIGNKSGESATLYTAWLDIPQNAVNPIASIQYFGEGDAIANYIHLGVNTSLSEGYSLLKTIETGGMGWQTDHVKLDAYKGRHIRLALKFETLGNTYLRFDNFRVYDTEASALTMIEADEVEFTVSTGHGVLKVDGAGDKQVSVYALNGLKMHCGQGDTALTLKPGIYVVKVGGTTIKTRVN